MSKILNSVSRTGFVNALPSRTKLLTLLRYEPSTGNLYWRRQVTPSVKIGVPIGLKEKLKGRRAVVRIDGTLFYVSRIIWRMMTGHDPGPEEVDHRDRDKTNDRWSNLKLTDRRGNVTNVDAVQKSEKCSIAARKRWPLHV